MAKEIKDIAASIKARLINLAKENREEAQSMLTRFGVERFLYRLSRSEHKDKFLLKGAALFALWFNQPHRPTKDVDLLGFGDNDTPTLEKLMREICEVESDDGLRFDPDTVHGELIREEEAYQGVRIKLTAFLGSARIPVQIDVGFGDAVTPDAETATMPTMLEMPAPTLRVYPKETVVAEKFEAMVRFGLANGRMKDFWDLDYLIREFDFDGKLLQKAIRATFANRRTVLPKELPVALTNDFAQNARVVAVWSGFINRNRIQTSTDLGKVIETLSEFFSPIIAAEESGSTLQGKWSEQKRWEM
jgi:predicted nucleotidyltransferase component of viral defense system